MRLIHRLRIGVAIKSTGPKTKRRREAVGKLRQTLAGGDPLPIR